MPSGGRVRDTAYGDLASWPGTRGLCKVREPGSDSSSATQHPSLHGLSLLLVPPASAGLRGDLGAELAAMAVL